MPDISGNYEGEGVAVVPDVGTSGSKGTTAMVPITRRRQLRVSSESARGATAISVGGGDQTLTSPSRGLYISGAGTLAVRFVDDTADVTLTGLAAGVWYPFAIRIVRQAGATATGFLLL